MPKIIIIHRFLVPEEFLFLRQVCRGDFDSCIWSLYLLKASLQLSNSELYSAEPDDIVLFNNYFLIFRILYYEPELLVNLLIRC